MGGGLDLLLGGAGVHGVGRPGPEAVAAAAVDVLAAAPRAPPRVVGQRLPAAQMRRKIVQMSSIVYQIFAGSSRRFSEMLVKSMPR